MATKQKRHTCIKCGRKLVESKMQRQSSYYLNVSRHWECQNNCRKTDTNISVQSPGNLDTFSPLDNQLSITDDLNDFIVYDAEILISPDLKIGCR